MAEPVYKLIDFRKKVNEELCYVNRLSKHLRSHQFVNAPHRHDFFLVILITGGSGTHTIDFVEYKVKPNTIFVMQPGQLHKWNLSRNIEGLVCLHAREFYEEFQNSHLLNELPFYRTINRVPFLSVSSKDASALRIHFEELLNEYNSASPLREQKLRVYLSSLYLDIARLYGPDITGRSNSYLHHLQMFQRLLDEQFVENRSPEHYARQLKLTVKHLNRVTKLSLAKTATGLIADRVVLEAKRLLGEGDTNIGDVAYRLNFSDVSYFTRYFKKHTGITPLSFVKRMR